LGFGKGTYSLLRKSEAGFAAQLDALAQAGVIGDDQRELAVGRDHPVFGGGHGEGTADAGFRSARQDSRPAGADGRRNPWG